MKATWQGNIALGRLGIPARLYAATRTLQPKLVQLHALDNSPVQRNLECKIEQHQIPFDEVVRGVEYEPGHYMSLTDQELSQVVLSPYKVISIRQFCDITTIEPQYYDKPYYVVPGHGGERAYALIREVFIRSMKMAVAQVVIHNKEYVAALRVEGDLLMLFLLRYASEIVPRSDIKTPSLSKPSPDEVEALTAVVERFGGPFYIGDFHDRRVENIQELIERKSKGLPLPRTEHIKASVTPEDEIIPALKDTLQRRRMISGGEN